ncbi:FxsA family protein [Sandaracinus amylolyticus]|uniref:FxsA family protein n=1 Tax=Sandaracinus amylolyticus TaxID=927083 RepID=UPI001F1C2133|nr:FxsA family protein [Sandaracinus amylolyticus]UJR85196.1 Hypothetical protein I5071_72760 [Sandaracinus amylolyticus]
MGWIALAMLAATSVELYVLLEVGDLLGFWPTIALVLGTAMLGGYLLKREGLRVFREWQRALAEMRMPEEGITSGLLVLVGGTLLMTPGVLSDVTGILLLIPPVRMVVARFIEARVRARMERGGGPGSVFDFRVVTPQGAYGRRRVVDVDGVVVEDREVRAPAPRARVGGDVIEGEIVDASTRRLERGE